MICFGIIEGYWLVRLGNCAPTERHTRDGQRHMNESTQKLGRNDSCPCGSGKKYKKCCLRKQRPGPGRQMRKDMEELIDLSLVPTAEARQQSVEAWTQRSNDTSLTSVDHAWAKVNLAQSLQHQGEHRKAMEVLDSIATFIETVTEPKLQVWARMTAGISLSALGRHSAATDLLKQCLTLLKDAALPTEIEGSVLLEAGNAFRGAGDSEQARICWAHAARLFSSNPEWKSNYARAHSNLALLLLNDPDNAKQEEGARILDSASNMKMVIGDIEGVAKNTCNLAMYYWRKGSYARAIAYMRKDVALTRKIGDQGALGVSLNNLAIIYRGARQLTPARHLLREARQIAEKLQDDKLLALTDHHLKAVDDMGREAGQKSEKVGPIAPCACGSGKIFQECCGQADFEPVDHPFESMGISEDLEAIHKTIQASGKRPWILDHILRHSEQAKKRLAWTEAHAHDGWLSWREAADMANLHLVSAQALADTTRTDKDSLAHPLGCIILSVCALEAFINQVIYFAVTMAPHAPPDFPPLPAEVAASAQEYQRSVALKEKWLTMGTVFCGSTWPPQPLWGEFCDLVDVRNELVHFKVNEFEQTIPPPKEEHAVVKRIPKTVETRKGPHSWPFRILSPSVAKWAATVADSLIVAFRQGYSERYLPRPNPESAIPSS
jgi:tetratricopeptide (TPR) repeat protein